MYFRSSWRPPCGSSRHTSCSTTSMSVWVRWLRSLSRKFFRWGIAPLHGHAGGSATLSATDAYGQSRAGDTLRLRLAGKDRKLIRACSAKSEKWLMHAQRANAQRENQSSKHESSGRQFERPNAARRPRRGAPLIILIGGQQTEKIAFGTNGTQKRRSGPGSKGRCRGDPTWRDACGARPAYTPRIKRDSQFSFASISSRTQFAPTVCPRSVTFMVSSGVPICS